MNLLHTWSNFNILDSVSFFINSLLGYLEIIFLVNFILFYVVLKVVTYFFNISKKNGPNSLATKYYFATTLVVSEFIVLLILQIFFSHIYGNKIKSNIYFINNLVLILQFFLAIIILFDKQFLTYILKLIASFFLATLFSIFLMNHLLRWFNYLHNNRILALWITTNIFISFIIMFFYLFNVKMLFLHNFAFQILIFLVLISNFENSSADLKTLNHSLVFKIILKIIKVLCLLDLFFLIKTVKKTMKNLWQINNDNPSGLIILLLLLNNIRFFNISQQNGLVNLPNKFLKNEINGWRGIIKE